LWRHRRTIIFIQRRIEHTSYGEGSKIDLLVLWLGEMSGDDPACKIRGLNGTDTNPDEFMNVDKMWFSYIFSLSVTMLSIFLTSGGGVAFVTRVRKLMLSGISFVKVLALSSYTSYTYPCYNNLSLFYYLKGSNHLLCNW
jgi:hypothetical protein